MSPDDDRGGLPRTSLEDLERIPVGPDAGSHSPEDWEQLRDLAVGRMQNGDLPAGTRIRWGRIALAALPGVYPEGGRSQQAVIGSARVRAYLIRECGPDATDPARDLPALRADVLRNLGTPGETAARLADGWQSLPREQMLRLRRIKNTLVDRSLRYGRVCPYRRQGARPTPLAWSSSQREPYGGLTAPVLHWT
ncbi:hypothetical protein GCM10010497_38400 [Streptomyces cinereoruber]|uniref:Uncharacterized protein n=1 Tax=Streptomyces cinereoruber TaxID=67260 RepID=A0AAV4KME1_9ACTN|nr:hypothetical protein [Streptomyces cinereoruber]MBB4159856.1 hypothetical protein [Streptomyces cinereoruber]MBY8817778.1 hypothetical protein [Streptomyces cinereoruber]NIH60564.1 hypothetical protein [Streptomyces cinereoruber]QEV33665.1 hypothetical protein CP977_17060 [Streptomyces cinereoruber]GGR32209.1 hypothetical protein GCM10010497_38400 [Streptomyces cinereoruber]